MKKPPINGIFWRMSCTTLAHAFSILIRCPYLLHSWNSVEEEKGEDASSGSEGSCNAAAVERVSWLVIGCFGRPRESVLSDQALRIDSIEVEWDLVSVKASCK